MSQKFRRLSQAQLMSEDDFSMMLNNLCQAWREKGKAEGRGLSTPEKADGKIRYYMHVIINAYHGALNQVD